MPPAQARVLIFRSPSVRRTAPQIALCSTENAVEKSSQATAFATGRFQQLHTLAVAIPSRPVEGSFAILVGFVNIDVKRMFELRFGNL